MTDILLAVFIALLYINTFIILRRVRRVQDQMWEEVNEAAQHALVDQHNMNQIRKLAERIVSLRVEAHHNLLEHFDELGEEGRKEMEGKFSEADALESVLDELVEHKFLDKEMKEALVALPGIPRHSQERDE